MLTAASFHCTCSRREDAHLWIVFRMREISPLHLLQDKRCFLLKLLGIGEALHCIFLQVKISQLNLLHKQWCSPLHLLKEEESPITFSLQGNDLDSCIYPGMGRFPNCFLMRRIEYYCILFQERRSFQYIVFEERRISPLYFLQGETILPLDFL